MLNVTDVATREFRSLLTGMEGPAPRVRVFIERRCPCGNVHLNLRLEKEIAATDREFAVAGVPFVADVETVPELPGVEIDYERDTLHQGFKVRSLNHSCGGHE